MLKYHTDLGGWGDTKVLGAPVRAEGALDDGDVSLTIVNTQQADAGVYGCRVQIPGMFNDLKVNINLILEKAPDKDPEVTPSYTEKGTKGTEFDLFSFLEAENIGRLAAVLLVTIILILVFIFWRKLQPTKTTLDTSAPENFYESIPMH
ncbi:hypothetical protein WMY93_009749 [Mugilogobius chulae]|uniref:Ig-like domain-containing protein n=1 Tax=Mugilogobius chulae TaxID=88201 RepID=A0AAW0PFG1_9GOBI